MGGTSLEYRIPPTLEVRSINHLQLLSHPIEDFPIQVTGFGKLSTSALENSWR